LRWTQICPTDQFGGDCVRKEVIEEGTGHRKILTPIIFFLCVIGSYAMRFSFFDVGLSMIIGAIAYFMEYYGYPVSPILLALFWGRWLSKTYAEP